MNTNQPIPSGGYGILRRRGHCFVVIKPDGERVVMGYCPPCMHSVIPDESVPETLLERIEREVMEHQQRLINALEGGPYGMD